MFKLIFFLCVVELNIKQTKDGKQELYSIKILNILYAFYNWLSNQQQTK